MRSSLKDFSWELEQAEERINEDNVRLEPVDWLYTNIHIMATSDTEQKSERILVRNMAKISQVRKIHKSTYSKFSKLQSVNVKIHRRHYNQTVKNQGQKVETSKGQTAHHSYKGSSIILTQIMGATKRINRNF